MVRPSQVNRNAGRFQGVMQLRNPTKELVEWVFKTTDKEGKAEITYERPVSGGVDLYFSSQKYMRSLGKRIAKHWPGELKSTRKLFTADYITGKRVYRVTVMFRLSSFKRGMTFEAEGKEYKIVKIGRYVTVQDKKSGKKENWKRERVLKYLPS